MMNDEKIIKHMIAFIEEAEKEALAAKFSGNNKSKTKVVNSILKELESEIKNADKKH